MILLPLAVGFPSGFGPSILLHAVSLCPWFPGWLEDRLVLSLAAPDMNGYGRV
uniref:Uncharacterized protein n=1 Tax=Arundo donax TaxID=35708 RepID=A0A0A9BNN6_ARUDO